MISPRKLHILPFLGLFQGSQHGFGPFRAYLEGHGPGFGSFWPYFGYNTMDMTIFEFLDLDLGLDVKYISWPKIINDGPNRMIYTTNPAK